MSHPSCKSGNKQTCTATYAIARGVTDFILSRLATFPRVGALWLLERFWGLEICSSTSVSLLIYCADVGEVKRNLKAYNISFWKVFEQIEDGIGWQYTYLKNECTSKQAFFEIFMIRLCMRVKKRRPGVCRHSVVRMSITNLLSNT